MSSTVLVILPNWLMSVMPVSTKILAMSAAFFSAEPLPSPDHLSVVPCARICCVMYLSATSLASVPVAAAICAGETPYVAMFAAMSASLMPGLASRKFTMSALLTAIFSS